MAVHVVRSASNGRVRDGAKGRDAGRTARTEVNDRPPSSATWYQPSAPGSSVPSSSSTRLTVAGRPSPAAGWSR